MSKLNPKGQDRLTKSMTGVSKNGNVQFTKDSEQQLFEIVVATLYGKDGFYESNTDRVDRLRKLTSEVVSKGNLDFIANVIVMARGPMKMRSMPILLTGIFASELRKQGKTFGKLRQVVADVIQRADQITDMYAVALHEFADKKSIPAAIKKGVADAFNKFNEYGLAKYNRDGSVKLRDVLLMVHPKAKDADQATAYERLRDDSLTTPITWETQLSQVGQDVKANWMEVLTSKGQTFDKLNDEFQKLVHTAKGEKWTELLQNDTLGYMALLRNLRNIHEADVPASVLQEKVYDRLADPVQVAKSKQLPYRFVSAMTHTEQFANNKLTRALSRALDASLANLPKLGENVLIILDVSSSMNGGWNRGKGMDTPINTAALFASTLFKANADADSVKLMMFSNNAHYLPLNADDSVMTMNKQIKDKVYGGGTDLAGAFAMVRADGLHKTVDTVILLSDMEVNGNGYYGFGNAAKAASTMFGKDVMKIAFNFNASETTCAAEKEGWIQMSGFSERIFDFIPAMRGAKSIVDQLSVPYVGVTHKNYTKTVKAA